jgi:hypothetical protein
MDPNVPERLLRPLKTKVWYRHNIMAYNTCTFTFKTYSRYSSTAVAFKKHKSPHAAALAGFQDYILVRNVGEISFLRKLSKK